tara:strand:- start:3429 stop:3635 length:207 start_codon:yes stop_codon:yes gene_type:complete
MTISKEWGREPDWFSSLDSDSQSNLIAMYRIENQTKEEHEKHKNITKKSNGMYRKNRSLLGVKWQRKR